MSNITRYGFDPHRNDVPVDAELVEQEGGAWVRYADHAAEVERLTAALEQVRVLAQGIIERNQGGYIGDRNDTKEIRSIAAAALVADKETP